MSIHKCYLALLFIVTGLVASTASADRYWHSPQYKITITNITKGQLFTPIVAASHKSSLAFFEPGQPAPVEIAYIAEAGNTAPLQEVLNASPQVHATAATDAPLLAGQTVEFMITARGNFNRLSLAAMLVPTNDSMVALNGVYLPFIGSETYFASAYDAGSETNDESCANIPGPQCGGMGFSPDEHGEGFVHLSSGVHGEGDLSASLYDWNDPVAKVVIERVR